MCLFSLSEEGGDKEEIADFLDLQVCLVQVRFCHRTSLPLGTFFFFFLVDLVELFVTQPPTSCMCGSIKAQGA